MSSPSSIEPSMAERRSVRETERCTERQEKHGSDGCQTRASACAPSPHHWGDEGPLIPSRCKRARNSLAAGRSRASEGPYCHGRGPSHWRLRAEQRKPPRRKRAARQSRTPSNTSTDGKKRAFSRTSGLHGSRYPGSGSTPNLRPCRALPFVGTDGDHRGLRFMALRSVVPGLAG